MLLLLLLPACALDPSGKLPEDSASEGDAEASPWEWTETGDKVAEPSADEVREALASSLPDLLSLGPGPVFDAYEQALAGRERGCPEFTSVGEREAWNGDCTTAGGWRYSGAAERTLRDGGHVLTLRTAMEAWGPRGEHAQLSGLAERVELEGGQEVYAVGTFAWSEAGEAWLREGRSVTLVGSAGEAEEGTRVWLDGGVSVGAASVTFEDLLLLPPEEGCAAEPTGGVRVRTAEGGVARVTFGEDDACDGCGVMDDGAAVCADLSPLLRYVAAPW